MSVLNKIDYKKKHKDTISVYQEVSKVSDYLKSSGYFLNRNDSLKKNKNNYIAYFSLSEKTKKAIIYLKPNSKEKRKKDSIVFSIEKLQPFLIKTSKKLDEQGKSFSKVSLENISIKGSIVYADLNMNESKRRIINKIIIKGYDNFPKSFLKNYFNIRSNTTFNQKIIREISKSSNNLRFTSEIKAPEVQFKKDSTLLYIYLKKEQQNSFDGLVNFASKENGGVLFNGTIDLKLNNVLNTGEKFELFWNSIAEERQEFKIATEIPYFLNSKLSPQLSFFIYKQDSTFLNTKFDSKIFYDFNSKIKLAFTYNSESSENLKENDIINIESFNNMFFGLQFQYIIPKKDFSFNNKFALKINPSIGKRKTNESSLNQIKIETIISYIWDLNFRNSIFINNNTGILISNSFLNNELFRIGGANSIRGFNEQSLFAEQYSFMNIEYRFLTSNKSYIYTISDFGRLNISNNKKNFTAFGLGFLFKNKNSIINISTSAGKTGKERIDLENLKLLVNWKIFF